MYERWLGLFKTFAPGMRWCIRPDGDDGAIYEIPRERGALMVKPDCLATLDVACCGSPRVLLKTYASGPNQFYGRHFICLGMAVYSVQAFYRIRGTCP